jgi:1-acyl-sn-glycerol-3-phosphate acyltransferase
MTSEYYPGDEYATPENVRRAASEYVLLGSRWSVYLHFVAGMFRNRAVALAGRYDTEAWARSSWEIKSTLERCRARFHIQGMNGVRAAAGPLVFVSNHMSTLETLALPGLIAPIKPVTFVVKEKLLHGFFWGPIMRARTPIAVSRTDPRADLQTVLQEGCAKLAAGISVVIFPQGTRKEVFIRSELNSLGAKLAGRAGVNLVPVAVKTDYWSSSGILRGFGAIHRDRPIHIEFGKPMAVLGRGKAEHEQCLDFIESRLRTWGAAVG